MAFCEFTCAMIKFIFLAGLIIQRAAGRPPNVAAAEGSPVTVTITLPITAEVAAMPLITVEIDHHDKGPKTDVVYIYVRTLTFKLQQKFESRLKVVNTFRTFELKFENATQDLAGTFRCYEGTGSSHEIKDCGHLLIILRKPEKPVIEALTKPALGATLELVCHTRSTSLPHDHNLRPLVMWQRPVINDEWQVDKIKVSEDGHLLVDHLSRDDHGLAFSCTCSDNANTTAPQSDRSDPYAVMFSVGDEGDSGKPFYSTVYITSHVLDASVVRPALGDELMYKCNVRCNPPCEASWSFSSKTDQHQRFQPMSASDVLSLSVKKEHEGTYRCEASNHEGTAYATFHLRIRP